MDRLSDEAVDAQYTPYPPPPELPLAGASGAEDVVAPPIELPLPGVSTVEIPTSDVTAAIQHGIRESTREIRRQVREECRAIAERFQENVRLAMREQLQTLDDRYARRSEMLELREEVRQIAGAIERMQIGRHDTPYALQGVADGHAPLAATAPGATMMHVPHINPALSQHAAHSYGPMRGDSTPNETPDDGQYSWQGPSRYHGGYEFQAEPYSQIGHTAHSAATRPGADLGIARHEPTRR